MSKTGSAAKVKLNSFDDLFGNNEMQTAGSEQIINAPLAELHDFKNHPFRVVDDEKMEETTESIRQYGVLVRRMGNHISLRLLFWQILFIGIVLLRYGIREPDIFLGGKRNFQMIC